MSTSFSQRVLAGRSAIVTGVSRRRGIGFAVARRLSELGADLFIQSWVPHDQEQSWGPDPEVEGIPGALRSAGGRVEHLSLDLGQPESPQQLLNAATEVFVHIDILVVNHARSSAQSLEELTAAELDLSFQVNSRASLLLVKEWATQHDDSHAGGRVILLTSGQHLGPMPSEIPYVLSKGGLHQVTQTLAFHLAPRGITVNCVNPGPTDTGWADKETHAAVLNRMPFGRGGKPDDAARLVGWLATDEAQWITGQVIDSEGGFTR